MKKTVILLLFLFMYYSCDNGDGDDWICMRNCNPALCLILDEAECICVSDIECMREKFCGGDVQNCGCKEKDGGSWCSALTGDSIKTWKFAYAFDSIRYDTLTEVWEYMYASPGAFQYVYRLDHIYFEYSEYHDYNEDYGIEIYSWKFDNLIQPTKIIFREIDSPSHWLVYRTYESTIKKLNPDTLILSQPYGGNFPGWFVYVADDNALNPK